MTKRAVKITQTYSPAPGRTIIVEGIPATEVTVGDETETMLNFTVRERVQSLIWRALRATSADVHHLAYTAPPGAQSMSGPRAR